jgi:hypothetical protein
MRIYKLKAFARFQRRERISDTTLIEAVDRVEAGLIDADLGGGLLKQRIARRGAGKRGGYRTIIACRRGDRAVFLYGFTKRDRDNIDDDELEELRAIGQRYLRLDATAIKTALAINELIEVQDGESQDQG